MAVRILVALWLTLGVTSVYCQRDDTLTIGEKFIGDIEAAFDDGIGYFTTPFRIDNADALNLLRFGVATGTAITLDKQLATSMRNVTHTKTLNGIMDFARDYGDIKYMLYLPAAMYIGGLFSGSDDVRITGRQIFQALLYSAGVTQSLKWIVGRARPDVSSDPLYARPVDFSGPHDSMFAMPSGHVTVAFAVSSVLAERIDNIYASIALYGLAGVTAISRMYHNRHWLSDVFVAGAIGTATGLYVTKQQEARSDIGSQLRFYPGLMGMSVEYTF